MKVLELQSLTKRFNGTEVVKDVSLSCQTGELTLVVGASGSGKSTLARMACGLLQPDSGQRFIRTSKDQSEEITAIGRDIQFVFQNPFSSLNPTRTLGDTLSSPLKNYLKLSGDALTSKIHGLLDQLALLPTGDFVNRYPHQLSGGQKQRIVLARALAAEPTFLIADEPTAMLDQSLKHEVYQLFRKLADNFGLGVIMVTHDLLGARDYADSITVLHEGTIVASATPDHIFNEVDHKQVTSLIQAASFPYPQKAANS